MMMNHQQKLQWYRITSRVIDDLINIGINKRAAVRMLAELFSEIEEMLEETELMESLDNGKIH